MPVRIDCGTADPFGATATKLLDTIPCAVGHIGFGCPDTGFWRRTAPDDLAFLDHHLATG